MLYQRVGSQAPCCEELIRVDYETDRANRDETQSCKSAKGGGEEIGVAERRGQVEFWTWDY